MVLMTKKRMTRPAGMAIIGGMGGGEVVVSRYTVDIVNSGSTGDC